MYDIVPFGGCPIFIGNIFKKKEQYVQENHPYDNYIIGFYSIKITDN